MFIWYFIIPTDLNAMNLTLPSINIYIITPAASSQADFWPHHRSGDGSTLAFCQIKASTWEVVVNWDIWDKKWVPHPKLGVAKSSYWPPPNMIELPLDKTCGSSYISNIIYHIPSVYIILLVNSTVCFPCDFLFILPFAFQPNSSVEYLATTLSQAVSQTYFSRKHLHFWPSSVLHGPPKLQWEAATFDISYTISFFHFYSFLNI